MTIGIIKGYTFNILLLNLYLLLALCSIKAYFLQNADAVIKICFLTILALFLLFFFRSKHVSYKDDFSFLFYFSMHIVLVFSIIVLLFDLIHVLESVYYNNQEYLFNIDGTNNIKSFIVSLLPMSYCLGEGQSIGAPPSENLFPAPNVDLQIQNNSGYLFILRPLIFGVFSYVGIRYFGETVSVPPSLIEVGTTTAREMTEIARTFPVSTLLTNGFISFGMSFVQLLTFASVTTGQLYRSIPKTLVKKILVGKRFFNKNPYLSFIFLTAGNFLSIK
jgi:hypothetical protein